MREYATRTVLLITVGGLFACAGPAPQSGKTASGIYYEVDGQGPPVLFAHGFSLDRRMWDREVEQLRPMYRVIRYDLRGHGLSDPLTEPFSAVQDMLDVFDATHIQRGTIVGLSAGAELALDFALAHPDRVSGLVLASPGLGGYQPVGSFDWMSSVMTELQAGSPEGATEAWVETPLMAIADDPSADSVMRNIVLDNWRVWTYDPSLQEAPDLPAIDRLSEVQAPTLILVGGDDFVDTRRVADTLAACLPAAELVTFEGVGHLMNLAAPDRFLEALHAFLERGPNRGGAPARAGC